MNRFLVRIISGILFALFASNCLMHIVTFYFSSSLYKEPSLYIIRQSTELIQYIIEQTPGASISNEIKYLGKILDCPLKIVSEDSIAIPEIYREDFLSGKLVYDSLNNGEEKLFVLLKDGRVLLIDPAFRRYLPQFKASSLIIIWCMLAFISIMVGILIAKPTVRRLNRLKFAFEKIRQGDIDARVKIFSGDLIGNVEKCFNEMACRIKLIIENRQHILNNVVQNFKKPVSYIKKHLIHLHCDISTNQIKKKYQKINCKINEINLLVIEFLTQEKIRQFSGIKPNEASVNDVWGEEVRDRMQDVSVLNIKNKDDDNISPHKKCVAKFILNISAGVFAVLLVNQLIVLVGPQIQYKYIGVKASWYPVQTIAALIQRAVDKTPPEELEKTIGLMGKRFERRLELVPPEEAILRFVLKKGKENFGGVMSYGIFNGMKVFNAPVHSGAYNLIIDNPSDQYWRGHDLTYHIIYFFVWFVFMMFFSILFSLPIIRDIKKLMEGIERLHMGDFGARVNIPSKRPIGTLAAHLNYMADHIQYLIENQRNLIHAIVHEIRTPLSRIRFHFEMLMSIEERRGVLEEAENINNELIELNLMLKELSMFTSFDTIQDTIRFEPIALHDTMHEIIGYYQKNRYSISMNMANDKEHNSIIYASPVYFKMAINNILSNALRYYRSHISVFYYREKNRIAIHICDDGPGIKHSDKKKVFEPFTRLDDSRNRESGGFGLGLAIVKRILQFHGGSVSIKDNTPNGVKVITYWPVKPSNTRL